jgi:hypothetical protein
MKKSKNLEQMDGKELLALYRRKVRLATNTTNESVAPSNNAHLKEVSKIRKELLKRLGTFSVLMDNFQPAPSHEETARKVGRD